MKTTISIITLIFISFSFMFFYKAYDRIEELEMNERVQKLLLEDTRTISNNWKVIAVDASQLVILQKQLIRLQEDNIKRLTK